MAVSFAWRRRMERHRAAGYRARVSAQGTTCAGWLPLRGFSTADSVSPLLARSWGSPAPFGAVDLALAYVEPPQSPRVPDGPWRGLIQQLSRQRLTAEVI